MSKFDQLRRKRSIKALQKARKLLEEELVYLSVKDDLPSYELYQAEDAHEHVCQALERLGGESG
jgi:hypothetical protein